MSKTVHFLLQGKGGVGKSLISSWLSQYLLNKNDNENILIIDTDPVNKSLSQYESLNTYKLELLEDSRINAKKFDELITMLFEDDFEHCVIDNGSSVFIPLSSYLVENNVFEMLDDQNINVYIHTIITGGQALNETLSGFKALAENTNKKNIIVWINEFFGKVELKNKTFTDMKVYLENVDKVKDIIQIRKRTDDLFPRDIENMITNKLTFDECIKSPQFNIMEKQRIKMVKDDMFRRVEQAGL